MAWMCPLVRVMAGRATAAPRWLAGIHTPPPTHPQESAVGWDGATYFPQVRIDIDIGRCGRVLVLVVAACLSVTVTVTVTVTTCHHVFIISTYGTVRLPLGPRDWMVTFS